MTEWLRVLLRSKVMRAWGKVARVAGLALPKKSVENSFRFFRRKVSCHRDKTRFGKRDASAPCVVCAASAAAAPTGNIGLLPPKLLF